MKQLHFKSLLFLILAFLPGCVRAQTYSESLVYSLCAPGGCSDVQGVQSSLIKARDGNLYGTEIGGPLTDGAVFKITTGGDYSVLYDFCFQGADNCPGGDWPNGLIQGSDGNLYGTTEAGGANGQGVVFKVTPGGQYSVLYNFGSLPDEADGVRPTTALTLGSDGNLYGTTSNTVFKITPSGSLTTLSAQVNGGSSLIQGQDGNFYGVAGGGITNDQACQYGCGTVFRMTPEGGVTTLYSFCSESNCVDGSNPGGSLVQGSNGNFYGITGFGGANGYGTLFQITPQGALTTLYSFCSETGCIDGEQQIGNLLLASDGNIYGVTELGGDVPAYDGQYAGEGTVYRLTTPYNQQSFESIYSFCYPYDGQECSDYSSMESLRPLAGLAQSNDGNLYGTTIAGGTAGGGTVYKLAATPALPAPVQISLSSSTVSPGASVTATFQVLNAFSLTMQQCYAFSSYNGGAMSPLGKVTGTLTKNIYTGSATFTAGAQGTYNFALTCGGVESGFATLTVAGTPTTTALVANPNPPTVGQQVMLTAQVRRTSGGGFATGAVRFQSGSTLLGTSTLNGSGVATFTASTNGLPPGSYPVTATYEGDSADAASTSPSLPVTLGQAPTSVILSADPTSVTPPANVALTATVTRSASGATGTPTGTVTFSSGTVTLATVNVNGSGVAAYTASSSGVPAGKYPVTARYNGDASDAASTSAAVDVTVK